MKRLPTSRQVERTVALLSAAAHPARLTMLLALARRGPLYAGALQAAARIEQSACSHQLRLLRDAGLVRADRRGRRMLYQLADHHVAHIVEDALSHANEG